MTTEKTIFQPNTRFEVLVVEKTKSGNTFWRQAGLAFPLKSESGGLRLKLHWFPELNIILKESLKPVQSTSETRNTDAIPF